MKTNYWTEPFSYQTRWGHKYVASENLKKAIDDIEKRLGGKVVSTRVLHDSPTRDSDFNYCEALVKLK